MQRTVFSSGALWQGVVISTCCTKTLEWFRYIPMTDISKWAMRLDRYVVHCARKPTTWRVAGFSTTDVYKPVTSPPTLASGCWKILRHSIVRLGSNSIDENAVSVRDRVLSVFDNYILRTDLCFTADVSLFFISQRDLRTPSADRRETLPHDRNLGEFYNASPKKSLTKDRAKTCKVCGDFINFRIWSRISRERVKISKIGNTCNRQRSSRILQKIRWYLVHKQKSYRYAYCPLTHPIIWTFSKFFGRLHFST